MTPARPSVLAKYCAAAVAAVLATLPLVAQAARTALAEKPLQELNRVKPNIMFTVDDSGSMMFEFLPDYTAEGPPPYVTPPAANTIYYCRDRRHCGGIVDVVRGLPVDPVTGLGTWAIYKADPPIRSSNYNRLFYDPSIPYNPGKRADTTDLPCEGSNAACSGPWTAVYRDGFAGYPGSNSGGTINLTNSYPDTAWCNKLANDPPTAADIATAATDGSKCRLNGRSYVASSDPVGGPSIWTTPSVAAGYNYPNSVDVATGSGTACGSASEYCVFNLPATVNGNPYYYTVSQVQFCQNKDNAGFGVSPCSDRWDETTYRYVRYGTDTSKSFDPAAFTRIDIVPTRASYPSGRNYAQEMSNFAKWYAFHRTRILAMKTAGGIAFSTLTDEDARVGLHTLRFGWDFSSGSYVANGNMNDNAFLNIADFNPTNKSTWFNSFYGMKVNGGTPLPDAVYRIGEYFSNSGKSGLPGAADPLDSTTGRCQQNYHLLSTDGYWNAQLSNASVGDADLTVPGTLPGTVPGFTAGSPFPRPYYEGPTPSSNSLADLSMYYWIRDLRPELLNKVKDTLAPWQHVTLYGLAIGAQGNIVYPTGIDAITAGLKDWPKPTGSERPDSIDDLWHAAVNSRGKFFNPSNSRQLGENIVAALADFTSQSGTGTAIGIAGAQLSSTRRYGYRTSYETGSWGDVRKYSLDPGTGALPVKVDGTPLNDPVWSAATQLDAQTLGTGWRTDRRIVTINDETGLPVPFRAADDLSSNQRDALNDGWAAVTPTPTAQAVLDFLRGDRTNEGSDTASFRIRSHILGDIVYSGAVPVGAPSQPYDDTGNPGYTAFAAAKSLRTPMVYVGANDGMLHAFNDSTTTDAGKEAWAYVPKTLFSATNPNKVPADYATLAEAKAASRAFQLGALSYRRGGIPLFAPKFYVNATPRVWDIDFANTNTATPPTAGNDWHTILVGGLGAGGRAIYALDVTNPVSLAETEADIIAANRVLWEFTDDDLGYVYDAPTLVKTRRYGWVVLVASGYNNSGEKGSGKGYLYVLNPRNGTLLKKLSTEVGNASDPSGLSTIRAYTASRKDPYLLQAYGGDLKGNVWRFDLSDADETKWKVERFARAVDAGGRAQPITTGVRVEIDQNNNVDRYLFVGTGMLLSDADVTGANPVSNVTNTLYVIRDGTRTTPEPAPATPYSRADLNRVDGTKVAGFTGAATGRGWYVDATNAKQKVVTDVSADVQTVVFGFSEPAEDACEGALATTLHAREFATGGSVLEASGGEIVASIADVGAVAGATLIQGAKGTGSASSGDVRVQVTTMKGQVFSFGVRLAGGSSPKHRLSWRLLNRD